MRKEFIKYVLDAEVNGFALTIRYIVRAMYEVIDDDGYATIKQEIVEDVTFSDKELDEKGGISEVLEDFKKRYVPLSK